MLDGIFNVLTAIGDFFSSVVDAITGFFNDLIGFVQQLQSIGEQVGSFLGGFPAVFVGGILGLIVCMVLLRVLGRD